MPDSVTASRQALRSMFNTVPRTYERVNHALTLGLDTRWRRRAIALAVRGEEQVCLDVCTGTGEMAGLLRGMVSSSCRVIGCDFSPAMLSQAAHARKGRRIAWACGDVMRLPLAPATVDLVTVSFAARNLMLTTDTLAGAMGALRRVLRPGGRLMILETSQPANAAVRWLFHLYVRSVVRPVGVLLSGTASPYAYLSRTILRFCDARELKTFLEDAGFSRVEVIPLCAGAAAVHIAHV